MNRLPVSVVDSAKITICESQPLLLFQYQLFSDILKPPRVMRRGSLCALAPLPLFGAMERRAEKFLTVSEVGVQCDSVLTVT